MNQKNHTLMGIATLLGVLSACDPPTHPRNYGNTILSSICHFEFDCCTPSERAAFLRFSQASSKDRCLEEVNDGFGGLMNVAAEAVDRGTATYDAEAAERCTATLRAASDQCDSAAFASPTGGFSFESIAFLVDPRDAECQALASRGFTRGTVKDGGDCINNVDCADFGTCIVTDEDGEDLVVAGECRAGLAEGEDCLDSNASCQPGLVCAADGCEAVELADNGDACSFSGSCASGFCTAEDGEGSCEGSGDECFDDFECEGSCVDDFCVGSGDECFDDFDCEGVCTPTQGECVEVKITVDACDGL